MPEYNFIFRLKENRGRDVSAYLVTCRDVFENYDLICCMHDKKSPSADTLFGMHYQNHCFENTLATKEYVQNIISLFSNNNHLGMLCPPPFFMVFKNKLGNNLEQLQILYETLNLSVPFDDSPNAPFGSMFWIRKEAIKPLFRKDWKYEDFPEEPLPNDGTISHAIERIYPAIAQEAGFLSAAVMPDFYAKILITNSLYDNKKDNYFERAGRVKRIEKIFSIKNIYINNKKYKQIYIFGTKILKPVTTNTNNSFLENIFSLKNDGGKKHKVITILGLKLKIKLHKKNTL